MTEPPRLYTEPESELERSLLDAGRGYSASSSTRAKTLAAIGIVSATASTTAAASAVGKASLVKWGVALAVVAGAAVPAVRYLRNHAAQPPASSAVVTAPGLGGTPTSPAEAPNAPQPSSEPAIASAGPTPSQSPIPAHAPGAAGPAALTAELSALDAARSALANGDATGALAGLDAYAHNFPHGKLSLEAEVLRIDALAKSGQTAAARKRAEAFMKRHPDSVLASRVRAYAGQ